MPAVLKNKRKNKSQKIVPAQGVPKPTFENIPHCSMQSKGIIFFILALLLVNFALGLPEDGQYTITPLSNNPGIYSDPWGSLRTYRSTWYLVSYIDLSKFFKLLDMLNEEHETFLREFANLKKALTLWRQMREMRESLDTLRKKHQKIKDLIQDYQEPHKVLFGKLDAKVAKFYDNLIENLDKDTRSIIDLNENHTKLIKSQFNEKRIKLDDSANNTLYNFNKLSYKIDTLEDESEINETLIDFAKTLKQSIAENEKDATILTDAILSAKQGKIHPKLLSPQEIIQGAKTIQLAQPNVEFLLPLQTEYISQLLNLSELTIYHTQEKLLYIISLTPLDLEKYILYSNIALPIYQNSNVLGAIFAYIKPHSPFTAISEDMKSYFHLDVNELKDCKNISNEFICKRVKFLYQKDDRSDCEVQIIVEPSFENFTSCDIRFRTSARTHWSRIHLTNQWVFSSAIPETILIKCENRILRTGVINGTGILYVPPLCEARIRSVLLKSSVEFTSKISTEFAPRTPLNISALYFAVIDSTVSLNLSEILSNVDSSSTSLNSNETEDSNASDGDVKFQTIINRAKKLIQQKRVNKGTQFRLEIIALYFVLGLGSLLILVGIAWKFSLLFLKYYTLLNTIRHNEIQMINL